MKYPAILILLIACLCSHAQPRVQIFDNVVASRIDWSFASTNRFVRNSLKVEFKEFATNDCALTECASPGVRKLLKLTITIINSGDATWLGPSITNRPDLYEFDQCHGHYHLQKWSEFALYRPNGGKKLVTGQKMGWCVRSGDPLLLGPEPWDGDQGSCTAPKLLPGWADTYGGNTPCMWLDVTAVPSGDYVLKVELDPFGIYGAVDQLLLGVRLSTNGVAASATPVKGTGRFK